MSIGEAAQPERHIQSEDPSIVRQQKRRDDHLAAIGNRDEATVERGVQVRGEKEPVENVEALGVGGTVRPRLISAMVSSWKRAGRAPTLERVPPAHGYFDCLGPPAS